MPILRRVGRWFVTHKRGEEEAEVAVSVSFLALRLAPLLGIGAAAASAATFALTTTSPVYHPPFTLSQRGAALITRFEGVRYHPYNDATRPPVCTVGVGHAFRPFHPCSTAEFRETFTPAQVTTLLMHDVSWAEQCVRDGVTHPIDVPQFDALVSFTFNIGCGGFDSSSVRSYANAGNPDGVAARLLLYDHAGAVELPGLRTRRIAEGRLYITGDYGPGIGRYLPPKPTKPGPNTGRCSGIEWPNRPRAVYTTIRCERSTR